MTKDSDTPTDQFATARATLRDNVKWLATGFAAVGGVVLAGTPFTGFGALEFPGLRFGIAALCLFAATLCAFLAWRILFFVLGPDPSYVNVLRENGDPQTLPALTKTERKEYQRVREEFIRHRDELLPNGVKFLDGLEALTTKAWDAYTQTQNANFQALWLQYTQNEQTVKYWASFVRLHYRVRSGVAKAQWLGLVILIALIGFVWAASPPEENDKKKGASDAPILVDQRTCDCAGSASDKTAGARVATVLFETGKSTLDGRALAEIQRARDYLNAHADMGLLLYARTDTVATDRINTPLAADRARVVQSALIREGGIAASRVFATTLPESDLPTLTGQEAAKVENRSVDLVAVRVPRIGSAR